MFQQLIKLKKLLTINEKKKFLNIMCMTFVMSILDMIGVVSVMPFIAVLSDNNLIESNYFLNKAFVFFGYNQKEFIYILGFGSLILLIFSQVFKSLTIFLQIKFSLMYEHSLSKRLLKGYLQQPYSWFLKKNTSEIAKNILSEVNSLVHGCFLPIISLFTQGMIVFTILTMLLIVNTKVSILAGLIIGASYTFIYFLVSRYLRSIGTQRPEHNKLRFRSINEAFGSFKMLKVMNLENFFLKSFSMPSQKIAEIDTIAASVKQFPRYLIEVFIFGGVLVTSMYYISFSKNILEVIPIIALYTFAAYRLMPAIQQIYSSLTQIKYIGPALEKISQDFDSLNLNEIHHNDEVLKLEKKIELKNIFFYYPGEIKPSIKNLNLDIEAKKKIGIVGETGSGKSTIIDLILGLLNPSSGFIKIDETELNKKNISAWQKNVGYVPQDIYLIDDTISSNIALGIDKFEIDYNLLDEVCKIANLYEFIKSSLSDGYQTIVGERGVRLSGGQIQRIGIARALYFQPKLLIFDEATNALDGITEKSIINSLESYNNEITIITIAHRLNTVINCDKIFLIDKGELVGEGTYEDLLKKNKKFFDMVNIS